MTGGVACVVVVPPCSHPQPPHLLHCILSCPLHPMVWVFMANACATICSHSWCNCAVRALMCSSWIWSFVWKSVFSSQFGWWGSAFYLLVGAWRRGCCHLSHIVGICRTSPPTWQMACWGPMGAWSWVCCQQFLGGKFSHTYGRASGKSWGCKSALGLRWCPWCWPSTWA